jgi:hypothetical protein
MEFQNKDKDLVYKLFSSGEHWAGIYVRMFWVSRSWFQELPTSPPPPAESYFGEKDW